MFGSGSDEYFMILRYKGKKLYKCAVYQYNYAKNKYYKPSYTAWYSGSEFGKPKVDGKGTVTLVKTEDALGGCFTDVYKRQIEPLAVAVHAVKRAFADGDVRGKKVLVLGAGTIGNLVAQSAKGLGAEAVMITDISDFKLKMAEDCGVEYVVNTAADDLAAVSYTHLDGVESIIWKWGNGIISDFRQQM